MTKAAAAAKQNVLKNRERKEAWLAEKEELHLSNLLPRRGIISPEIKRARQEWYSANPGKEAPWIKFSCG